MNSSSEVFLDPILEKFRQREIERVARIAAPGVNQGKIVELLKTKGPLSRRNIRELSGLPDGSVGGTLYHYKQIFVRNTETGEWDLTDSFKTEKIV